jgi:uncharacterized FlaG/YvyC family protein
MWMEEIDMNITPLPGISQATPAAAAPARAAENREVVQAVKAANAAKLFGQDTELTFALDRQTQKPVIRIVKRGTNELIRQIPAEQLLSLATDLPRS